MKTLTTIGAAGVALAVATAAHAETTLKIACYLPPFSVSVSKVLKPFAQAVTAETKGDVKFQEYWGGSLGRSPEQQYKLVTGGITDIVFIATYSSGGQFPDASITELPGLIPSSTVGAPAFWRFFKTGMMRGHDDIKTVSVYMPSVNQLHARKPINKIEDMKGLKIAAGGSNFAEFIKNAGGVPVYLPAPQLAQGLTSGVVDGTTVDWVGYVTFKLQSLAKYHYEVPLGGISFVIAMNKGKWNALSAAGKAAIDKFGGERMAAIGGKAYDVAGDARRAKVLKDKSQHDVVPSKAEIKRIIDTYGKPVHKMWIEKTPDGQKKYDTFEKLLADVEAGK